MSGGHAELDFFGVAWRLGATLFFVLLNGFFVAAEFALVKVRDSRIEELARDRNRSARTGDQVTVGPYTATVIDASRRRAQRLRLERSEPLSADEPE